MKRNRTIYFVKSMMILLIIWATISTVKADTSERTEVKIKVAIHNQEERIGTSTDTHYFEVLPEYNWTVGNSTYIFNTTKTHVDDLGKNWINTDGYRVFIMVGGSDEQIWCAFPNWPFIGYDAGDIIVNLRKFVESGKGYIGHCGGAMFPLTLDKSYYTPYENIEDKTSFIDAGIKFHNNMGIPRISQYVYYDNDGILRFCQNTSRSR